ncbi:response regulator [Usitatibacter palustris]|uniref:Sensor histidine kinase RcsC n=1 Tax=Usitatibacter palustris TaxID=2732487 RepID=A0A6M4HB95_9PROT|nr:response regulator [Usitatibacter palustris]QJR15744.1 Sensor histidine kinase RcsC [Usitatibacter palustris]
MEKQNPTNHEFGQSARGLASTGEELVGLVSVIRDAIDSARPEVENLGHRIEASLPDRAIVVRADPERLTRVFADMILGAARKAPPASRVVLDVVHEASWVQVTVSEAGERMGHVYGNVGLATEFEAGKPRDLSESAKGVLGSGLRILIVEDHPDTAISFGKLLEALGNEVRIATNGPDALAIGQEFRPDVVLLDIGLPFMNGFEIARKLRERYWGRSAVVIATTAWDQEEDKRNSVAAGIDHHLVKPVDPIGLAKLLADTAKSH